MRRALKKVFFSLVLAFLSFTAKAEMKKNAVYLGIAALNYKMTVRTEDNKVDTEMVRSKTVTPMIGYLRVPEPIFKKDWLEWLRWSVEFSASPYKANREIADRVTDVPGTFDSNEGKEIDFGTKVSGAVAYVNPTLNLFYDFSENVYAYIGFGAGLGYAYARGSYYQLQDKTNAACAASTTFSSVTANCPKKDVHFNSVSVSSNAILGLSLSSFGIRYERGGPEIKRNHMKYALHNEMFAFFYQYRF